MSKRTHVASTAGPIVLEDRDASSPYAGVGKPDGFWYEVGGDWRRWCRGNAFHCERFLHTVDLKDCNVLRISSLPQLKEFQKKYFEPLLHYGLGGIDWAEVALLFDGVEIAPYHREYRFRLPDFLWYNSWDCASGVIWRPRGATVTFAKEIDREKASV